MGTIILATTVTMTTVRDSSRYRTWRSMTTREMIKAAVQTLASTRGAIHGWPSLCRHDIFRRLESSSRPKCCCKSMLRLLTSTSLLGIFATAMTCTDKRIRDRNVPPAAADLDNDITLTNHISLHWKQQIQSNEQILDMVPQNLLVPDSFVEI